MRAASQRAGRYERQPANYQAFIPAPLPPAPPLRLEGELQRLLSSADVALGRLDGSIETLPNPDLFVFMYVRKEAVLSSQIEGTQSSLQDVLAAEAEITSADSPKDADEVINYIAAMKHGLARLSDLPVSIRLIREIHERLLQGVRGSRLTPGELRQSQNWIGGTRHGNAISVPPPPEQVPALLSALEQFIHQPAADLPPLVRIALVHVQFETIHPFLDGNGRIGRLLIAALFEQWGVLTEPLMYVSGFLKQHQAEYYRRLSAVRTDGDWEAWVGFFLEGVARSAEAAERSIIALASLINADRRRLLQTPKATPASLRLFELLPTMPRFSIEQARQRLNTTFPTATAAVTLLQSLGIVSEQTGQKKHRLFSYQAYVDLLSG